MSKSLSTISTNVQTAEAQAWMRAAEMGDVARLQSLLRAGAPINFASENGETALMRAAARGYADVVGFLLDEGAEINAHREDGFNALIVAVFFGQEDVVRALLSRGADTSAQTRLGTTAEKWAAARGFAEIVELLKAADAEHGRGLKEAQHAVIMTGQIDDGQSLPDESVSQPVESLSGQTSAAGKIGESTAELLTRRLQPLMHQPVAHAPARTFVSAPPVSPTFSEPSIESEAGRTPAAPKVKSPPSPASSVPRFKAAIATWPVTMVALPLVLISGGIAGYAVWQRTKTHVNASQPAIQATTQTVEQIGASSQQPPVMPVAAPPVLNAETQPTPPFMPVDANGVTFSDVNVVPLPGAVVSASEAGLRPTTSIPPATNIPSTPALISESSDQTSDADTKVRRETQSVQREQASTPVTIKNDGSQPTGVQADSTSSRPEKQERVAVSPTPVNSVTTQAISAPQPTPKKRVIQWP